MRRTRRIAGCFSVIALLCVPAPLAAQQFAFGIRSDNDLFNPSADRRTDHEYTAGNFLWLEWAGDAIANSPYAASCGRSTSCEYRIRLEFAQRMFTPRIATDDFPLPGQRPHAGYISMRLQSSIDRGNWEPGVWLEVGAVGPIAFAKEAQQLVHELLSFREPRGWDQQLPNEPVLNIGGSIRGRFSSGSTSGRLAMSPFAAFNAGTGNVDGTAGLTLALSVGRSSLLGRDPQRYGARIEAGSAYSAVLRDIMLDGTLFSESRHVTSRRFVPRAFAGLAVTLQRFDLSYSIHWRGRSYESEPGGHTFSTLEVAFRAR